MFSLRRKSDTKGKEMPSHELPPEAAELLPVNRADRSAHLRLFSLIAKATLATVEDSAETVEERRVINFWYGGKHLGYLC